MDGYLTARSEAPSRLLSTLTKRARRLAKAAGYRAAARRRHGSADWHDARHLWPAFTQGED